jgi:hydroxymethylbilane synthase
MRKLRIGSRKSALAMWQANTVAAMLGSKGWQTDIVTIETRGDKVRNTPIAEIGGKGVFTEEIETLLKKGGIDLAVHSAKDMPSQLPEGFSLIAFTAREKVHDVLVSTNAGIFPADSTIPLCIGTSSVRRVALLKHFYPHITTVNMRGNLQTRIKKMKSGACDALMLAYAGVRRMDYTHMIVSELSETDFIPPAGQGCLAIEVFETIDPVVKAQIRECLNHEETEYALTAERAFLETLKGGCSIPVFALAESIDTQISLNAGLISLDGKTLLKTRMTGDKADARRLGVQAGRKVLSDGGDKILHEIRRMRANIE